VIDNIIIKVVTLLQKKSYNLSKKSCYKDNISNNNKSCYKNNIYIFLIDDNVCVGGCGSLEIA